ncbi:KXD1 [Acanthosepion pharaonis]|uniref:KXD1 n=1 Tax=Acanthosepion pharaonis TaxID=158019 RepID=A0A812CEB2_ACAPH|nr:KXD1 [Sepia pharaonis]
MSDNNIRSFSGEDYATAFTKALTCQINKEDVSCMVQTQKEMLSRYEKTNEMLINFNLLSSSRYEATCHKFKKDTLLLYEMKKDLDAVFKRIRNLKQRLSKIYPDAFSACSNVYLNVLETGENDDSFSQDTASTSSRTLDSAVLPSPSSASDHHTGNGQTAQANN